MCLPSFTHKYPQDKNPNHTCLLTKFQHAHQVSVFPFSQRDHMEGEKEKEKLWPGPTFPLRIQAVKRGLELNFILKWNKRI